MTLAIDHIVVCVPDLATAAAEYEESHGVVAVEGGRHTGHGTANRLIPLGDCYIELLAVVDPREARFSTLGAWTAHRAARPGADALCVRTDDLDEVCQRLGLQSTEMGRVTPGGLTLSWRLAGLKQAMSRGLPFFIQWDVPPELHPGRSVVEHPAGDVSLAEVTLSGDLGEMTRWTEGLTGLDVTGGDPAVTFRLDGAGSHRPSR